MLSNTDMKHSELPSLAVYPEAHGKTPLPSAYAVIGSEVVKQAEVAVYSAMNASANQAYADHLAAPGPEVTEDIYRRRAEDVTQSLGYPAESIQADYEEAGSYRAMAQEGVRMFAAEAKQHVGELRTALAEKLKNLKAVRANFREFAAKGDAAAVDGLLQESRMPEMFTRWRTAAGQGSKDKPWLSWLSEDATNTQLLNFLQWHNHKIIEANENPENRAEIERRRQVFVEGADYLNKNDCIVTDKYRVEKLKTIPIYVGDTITMAAESNAGLAERQNYILLRQDAVKDTEGITIEHELAHFIVNAGGALEEPATDVVAAAATTQSLDPITIHKLLIRDRKKAYIPADTQLLQFFISYKDRPPTSLKEFMRYVTSPSDERKGVTQAIFEQSLEQHCGFPGALQFFEKVVSEKLPKASDDHKSHAH